MMEFFSGETAHLALFSGTKKQKTRRQGRGSRAF
jgi:hypothetical protein